MKRLVTILVIIALVPQLSAGWIKLYGEHGKWEKEMGYGVALSPDGGYTVVGATGDLGTMTWLLKTDSEGDTLWTRSYAFTSDNRSGNGYCIKAAQGGGYIIAGYALLPLDQGSYQLFLMRTDDSGDTLWVKFYGTENEDRGYWVCQTADGGYAATGIADASSELPRRLFLVRTDSEGDTLWTKKYGGEGTLPDWGECVVETSDGGFIVTGHTKSLSQYENFDVWLLKTDSKGDTLWTRTFGGENWDGGYQVIVTSDGGYAIAGVYDLTGSMFPESGDMLLIKTDSAGNLEWQKTYGMTGGGFVDQAYGIEQTSDGGYIVVGTKGGIEPTYSELWLLKTDSLGDTLWTRTFGGYKMDYGKSVHQTPDGGYIITGYTNSYSEEVVDYDLWLIKTDSLGYVSMEESPVTHLPDFEIVNSVIPVGGSVVLHYSNYPQGFRASIYDATGRKVDSIQSSSPSGSITWGTGQNAGVYIIREEGGTRAKVVLVK